MNSYIIIFQFIELKSFLFFLIFNIQDTDSEYKCILSFFCPILPFNIDTYQ